MFDRAAFYQTPVVVRLKAKWKEKECKYDWKNTIKRYKDFKREGGGMRVLDSLRSCFACWCRITRPFSSPGDFTHEQLQLVGIPVGETNNTRVGGQDIDPAEDSEHETRTSVNL